MKFYYLCTPEMFSTNVGHEMKYAVTAQVSGKQHSSVPPALNMKTCIWLRESCSLPCVLLLANMYRPLVKYPWDWISTMWFFWIFQHLCHALILLRNQGLMSPTSLLELFFQLFRCQDKLLRKTLSNYIVQDIKNVNQKHKNVKLNVVCWLSSSFSLYLSVLPIALWA